MAGSVWVVVASKDGLVGSFICSSKDGLKDGLKDGFAGPGSG